MANKTKSVCWDSLFEDVLIQIFSKLDFDSLLSVASVCHSWRFVAHYPECWDSVHSYHHERFVDQYIKETVIPHHQECSDFVHSSYQERFVDRYVKETVRSHRQDRWDFVHSRYHEGFVERLFRESEYMIRHVAAGDKSIWVHPNADDAMVRKIADRCPSIESISLRYCDGISPAALLNLIHNCKHLKLVDIKLCSSVSASLIEEMGRSCPSLVGINLGNLKVKEEIATAIGKFMPKLKWLNLNGATISCEVLCMILDSCTELDHVNVKSCHRLIMKEELKNRVARIAEFNYSHGVQFQFMPMLYIPSIAQIIGWASPSNGPQPDTFPYTFTNL